MGADLTIDDLRKALARFNAGEEWETIGPAFGKTGNAIRKRVRRALISGRVSNTCARRGVEAAAEAGGGIAWTEDSGGATLESGRSATIRTLDDLLAACDVDLTHWTVDRWTANKWDSVMRDADGEPRLTELFQVKAYLKPIAGAAAAAELVASLIKDMREHSPRYKAANYPARPDGSDRHLVVISMADQHIGLLSWAPESGESYDADIAERLAAEAMADVLSKAAAYSPELITVLFAGDFLHTDRTIDGKGGTTTKGTVQETDGRWQKVFRIGVRTAIGMIDAARALAPVRVVFRPGNHDEQSLFMLGDVVSAWYRNDPDVAVDNPPVPRYYQRYGATLLGFCHGHNEKPDRLPMLMATEARDDWAATTFQDWFTGHLHRAGVVLKEDSGVQIHTAPSLCAADAWHSAKGLMHRRTCIAHVYEYDSGPVAQLVFNARRRLAA